MKRDFKFFYKAGSDEKLFLLENEFEDFPEDLNEGKVIFIILYERLYRGNEHLLIYHTTLEVVEEGYINIFEIEGNFEYLYEFLIL